MQVGLVETKALFLNENEVVRYNKNGRDISHGTNDKIDYQMIC